MSQKLTKRDWREMESEAKCHEAALSQRLAVMTVQEQCEFQIKARLLHENPNTTNSVAGLMALAGLAAGSRFLADQALYAIQQGGAD